jgi:molybdenum cofactor synthesis domain-containing protein
VTTSAAPGRHIRRAGLDFTRGSVLMKSGTRLTDRDLALAAAMNHPAVPVHRLPKVAVLATGDELVMPGSEPGIGEIVYSNGYATMAMARGEGCRVEDLGIVPDRLDETAAAVRRARDLGADILVTSGGASVGDYDLVQKALARSSQTRRARRLPSSHAVRGFRGPPGRHAVSPAGQFDAAPVGASRLPADPRAPRPCRPGGQPLRHH